MNAGAIVTGSILFLGGYVVWKIAHRGGVAAPIEADTYTTIWHAAGLMLVIGFLAEISPELGAAFGVMIVAGFAMTRIAAGQSILPTAAESAPNPILTGPPGSPSSPPVTGHPGAVSCPSGSVNINGQCVPISVN